MKLNNRRISRSAVGSLMALSLFLSLLATVPAPSSTEAQQAFPAPLELPAMALDPVILANAGVAGYTSLGGRTAGTEELTRIA
ncbi:MAG: hypothetical protein AB7U20_24650, partial [Planctomycetaceae bacterium]